DEFQQFEPAEGIALVQITGLPNDRVQVVITGTDAAPTADVSTIAAGLTLNIARGVAQEDVEDEALRVVVTGEEGSRYFEPNTATATRTDTPLRDIPQSIQVVPREVLEDQQVIRLGDALRNVSGVVRDAQSFNGERFTVRGFDGTSILQDGFRQTFGQGDAGFPEIANLETVEVLKGPASVLAGSLEPGGVINLVNKQPLSEPFYDLGLQIGNRGLIAPRLDFSGPLTEDGRLLYRLNALVRTEDSFRDFDTDIERSFIAPTISWQISDRTDLTVRLEYTDEERPSDTGLVAIGDEVADIPFDRVIGIPGEDVSREEILRVAYNFEHRFSDRWRIRNAFSYLDRERETGYTAAFGPLNETTGDFPLLSVFQRLPQEVFNLQTNVVGEFNTGSVEHTVLFGVDLFRQTVRGNELRGGIFSPFVLNIFDPVYSGLTRPDLEDTVIATLQDTQTDALGVYFQDQITLLDNLKLLAGVRYETVEQEVTNKPTFFNPLESETSQSEDAFSPRIGLVYQPIEALSLYGSYTTSFVPNTATTVDGELLKPERGEQFEIGTRAELLEGRLTANLAFFDITKQNVATPDPNDPTNTSFIATGEQRSRGIELDIIGEILPGWNVVANYAYTDAEITDDEDFEGNRLTDAPRHNFNLWTTYDIQDGPLTGLGFGLGVNFVGERSGDLANTFEVDRYFLTNAAVSYERDNWRAALNIRNLFDVDYIESTGVNRTFGIAPGESFTLIGSFAIEF
ncbi:MAG: TonB-dependent siderophore receptor, partial [Cyanobacteria bacterium P01_H01_bin.58]